MNSQYLTYKEAMNYMNIHSYITLNKMIDDGLPALKIGNVKRISKDELDKYLASKTVRG